MYTYAIRVRKGFLLVSYYNLDSNFGLIFKLLLFFQDNFSNKFAIFDHFHSCILTSIKSMYLDFFTGSNPHNKNGESVAFCGRKKFKRKRIWFATRVIWWGRRFGAKSKQTTISRFVCLMLVWLAWKSAAKSNEKLVKSILCLTPLIMDAPYNSGLSQAGGGALFGRSVNPTSTRWAHYALHITTCHSGFSDLATAL